MAISIAFIPGRLLSGTIGVILAIITGITIVVLYSIAIYHMFLLSLIQKEKRFYVFEALLIFNQYLYRVKNLEIDPKIDFDTFCMQVQVSFLQSSINPSISNKYSSLNNFNNLNYSSQKIAFATLTNPIAFMEQLSIEFDTFQKKKFITSEICQIAKEILEYETIIINLRDDLVNGLIEEEVYQSSKYFLDIEILSRLSELKKEIEEFEKETSAKSDEENDEYTDETNPDDEEEYAEETNYEEIEAFDMNAIPQIKVNQFAWHTRTGSPYNEHLILETALRTLTIENNSTNAYYKDKEKNETIKFKKEDILEIDLQKATYLTSPFPTNKYTLDSLNQPGRLIIKLRNQQILSVIWNVNSKINQNYHYLHSILADMGLFPFI